MSHVYTPTPTKLARNDATLPDNITDRRDAASVNTPFQALADGIEFLSARVRLANFWPVVVSASATNAGTHSLGGNAWPSTNLVVAVDSTILGAPYTTAGTPKGFCFLRHLGPEQLTDGCTLTEVRLNLDSAGNTHTNLPACMPSIRVVRTVPGSGTIQDLLSTGGGVVTDPSATVGAFDVQHDIVYTANQNNVIDHSTYRYALSYQQEGGVDAVSYQRIWGVKFTHAR